MFKHTTGTIFAAVFVFYKILEVRNKEQIKEYMKIALTRLIGAIGAVLMLILYLLLTGTMADFIDYTIVGIKTFSNKVSYTTLFNSKYGEVKILAGIVPAQIIVMLVIYLYSFFNKNIKEKDWFKTITILLAYSIGTIAVTFPIADKVHFAIGSMCTTMAFIYLIYSIFKLTIKKETKMKKVLKIYFEITAKLLLIVGAIYTIYSVICYTKNPERRTNIEHFRNIMIDDNLYSRIVELSNYIKEQSKDGRTVYILDATAATYQIPADKYNKNYDMFNRGNLGGRGQNGVLDDIESKENLLLLIMKDDYKKNWQHPKALTDYIIENYDKVGEIDIFDIYQK